METEERQVNPPPHYSSLIPLHPLPHYLSPSFLSIHHPHYLSPSFLSVILLITSLRIERNEGWRGGEED
jgi:hypothetical protein